jgi:methionyl aminopeptidase
VLDLAIDNIKPGRKWSQIARLMQNFAERSGHGVVKNFVGHGVGEDMHEEPQVPNYYDGKDPKWRDFDLRPGMTIAVEPMCIMGGSDDTVVDETDGWTVRSANGQPAAHYEHTIAVTEHGSELLTDGR